MCGNVAFSENEINIKFIYKFIKNFKFYFLNVIIKNKLQLVAFRKWLKKPHYLFLIDVNLAKVDFSNLNISNIFIRVVMKNIF